MSLRAVALSALLLALSLPAEGAHAPRKATQVQRAQRKQKKAFPPVSLTHLTTHESFVLQPDARGRFTTARLRGLRRFLRCHHTGRQHAMAPRLARLIYTTARHFDGDRVTVIAGYRAPRVAREKGNPRSPHKRGVACDFRVEGVANEDLRDYLRRSFADAGVGYYPNSGFVHLDVGRKRRAFWIDYSRPGEPAQYRAPDEEPTVETAAPTDDPGIASASR